MVASPRLGAVAALAVLLVACGQAPAPQELVAVPHPETQDRVPADTSRGSGAGSPVTAQASRRAAGAAGPSRDEDPDAEQRGEQSAQQGGKDVARAQRQQGPSPSRTRALLSERLAEAAALDHDHLLADVSGGRVAELLLALLDTDGRVVVEARRWVDDAYELTDRVGAGAADAIGQVRLAEIEGRDSSLVVLPLRSDGRPRIAVWETTPGAALRTPDRCPVSSGASLRSALGQARTVVCSAQQVGDGRALVWREGAFRPPETLVQ